MRHDTHILSEEERKYREDKRAKQRESLEMLRKLEEEYWVVRHKTKE